MAIRQLVLLRLETAQPDKDAIRRAVSVLAMPVNAKLSAKLLYETVDSMRRWSKRSNFSFYTKRGTPVLYSATMLAWLADNSSNLDKTVGFLDRRLAEVAKSKIDQTSAYIHVCRPAFCWHDHARFCQTPLALSVLFDKIRP